MSASVHADALIEAAVHYAARGWHVLPIVSVRGGRCACRNLECERNAGKHPHGALVPNGLLQATTDPETIRCWWEEVPDANVAIRTGVASGVWVLDIDPEKGGTESLAELVARHGPLPETVEQLTGGGGRHLYFRHPGPGVSVPNSASALGPGLDVRGDGGYVVIFPSIHRSGRAYEWEASHHPDETALAPAPDWLLRRILTPSTNENWHRSAEDWAQLLQGAPEGQRHQVLTRMVGHYLGLGLPSAEVDEILLGFAARCRPPHDPKDVRRVIRDLAEKDAGKIPPASAIASPLTAPTGALVGLGLEFAQLYSQYLEAPLAFFYFVFLAYFGALVSQKITLASELRPQPRLYVVLLGDSADTRKSTSLYMADRFFRSLGPEWELPVLYGVGSAEGMAAELARQPSHSVLLHFDELKGFVDKAKHEGSVALPMVSTLFERNDYDNVTKKDRLSVRDAHVSLVAACTGDTYATMFDRTFFAIGFLNRLWLVSDRTTKRIAVPEPIPDVDLERLRAAVRDRLQAIDQAWTRNGRQPVPYPIDPEALAVFDAWYAAREGSIFEKRLETYGHRLMLLLAATLGRVHVDRDIVEHVVALLRYQLDVRRETDPVDAENTIAALEERIRRALTRGAMTRRDLQRRVHYNRVGIWAWDTALANLKRAHEVASDKSGAHFWLASNVDGVTTSVTTPEMTKTVLSDGDLSNTGGGGRQSVQTASIPISPPQMAGSGSPDAEIPYAASGGDRSGDSSRHSEACDCRICVP